MAPKSKSIYRQPGTQRYQLVHRSQRDPLINDPDAGGRVLKSLDAPQARKGKTRAEIAPSAEELAAVRPNEGEASNYGVYFDDTTYDYMQHLRGVGEVADAILLDVPEPKTRATASSSKRGGDGDDFFVERSSVARTKPKAAAAELDPSVLPSTNEIPFSLAHTRLNADVAPELRGLQPDMDPHLRQVLEALEDDAFVASGAGDAEDGDWLGELVETGEVGSMMEVEEYDFAEWGIDDDNYPLPAPREVDEEEEEDEEEGDEQPEESWQDRFRAFKRSEEKQRAEADAASNDDDDDDDERGSEGRDTLGGLPAMSVRGGKKRRKGQSDASGYSMSSSSMFRNKGLSTLDDQFDQIEKIYEESSDDDDDPSDTEYDENGDPIAPTLVTREDFDSMLDDFLDKFEIVGNKLKPVLEGETAMDKLATFRGLEDHGGEAERKERERILEMNRQAEAEGYDEESDDEKIPLPELVKSEQDRGWDCETILSTYSTTENRPKLLDERGPRDPNAPPPRRKSRKAAAIVPMPEPVSDVEEENESDDEERRGQAQPRPKDETKEEKRARKAAIKEERSARRAEKKSTKQVFAQERNAQVNQHRGKVGGGRAADLSVSKNDKVGIVRLL